MPDAMCRLAVQHGPDTVELLLPTDAPVGLLLPSVVDLVEPAGSGTDEALNWYLSRIGGGPLDEEISLRDNAVHDGELLLLSTAPPPTPVRVPDDPWQVLVETRDSRCAPKHAMTTSCLGASLLGAAMLAWAGVVTQATGHVVTAGVIAVTAATAAVAVRRAYPETVVTTLCVIAVVFGAVTAFLAVPSRPSMANVLLAAAVAFATSLLLLRVTRCGAICLTALVTSTALTTIASACSVAATLPVTATGAVLATLAVVTLGATARLSIATAGLAAHAGDDDDDLTPHAIAAHQSMTGLVAGSASAAAVGAVLVASGTPARPQAVLFTAVVGLVMVLRARTHTDMRRSIALVAAGMVAMAAGCVALVICTPAQANWVSLIDLAVGLGMLGRGFGATRNLLASRAVDVLEYVALAAVLPLACWVGDLYGLVLS